MSGTSQFRVYLCGPISGCTDIQKHKWRDDVKKKYGKYFDFIDPTDELLDHEASSAEFVDADLRAVESSSGLLANMWRESIGTALGLVHASRVGRPVVLADPNFLRHRMLQFYADAVADTVPKAAKALLALLRAEAGWLVLKSDGRQEPFARQKIISSVGRICRRERQDDIVVPRLVLADVITELERSDRWVGNAVGSTEIDQAVLKILRRRQRQRDPAFASLATAWRRRNDDPAPFPRRVHPSRQRSLVRDSPGVSGPVQVPVSCGSKAHSTIWGKTVRRLDDIPSAAARQVFRTVVAVPGITRVSLGPFSRGETRASCCATVEASPTPFVLEGKLFDAGEKGTLQTFQVRVQADAEKERIASAVAKALAARGLWSESTVNPPRQPKTS